MPGAVVDIDVHSRRVRATTTTTKGAFALRVPPGSYTIKPTVAGGPRTATSQPLTIGGVGHRHSQRGHGDAVMLS